MSVLVKSPLTTTRYRPGAATYCTGQRYKKLKSMGTRHKENTRENMTLENLCTMVKLRVGDRGKINITVFNNIVIFHSHL